VTYEPDPDVMDIARRVADSLEQAGIPYAIGGALAYAYWGPPRSTHDIDLNVFLGPEDVDRGLDVLRAAGVTFDRDESRQRAAEGAHVRASVGNTPIDVFFNSIDLHDSAARRVVERPFHGRPARILTAEDLAVLKLLFHRPKDRIDVERLVALQGSGMDLAYVRRWLVECVGDDDHRVEEWDALLRDLGLGA
jgi:hypothetical protein